MRSEIGVALLVSFVAGMATSLGGLLGLRLKKPGPRLISATLGFSAGVMILVSFVELLPLGMKRVGFASAHLSFFAGMLLMYLVDSLIPHEYFAERSAPLSAKEGKLYRTGLLVALGIGIHNLPEGMATFAGTLQDFRLGLAIAVAVAIHNVPEGLAVSAPVYFATGNRRKGFLWALYSGLAEPAGAALAALLLLPFLSDTVLGVVLSTVAGIMVYISMDELIPASREYGEDNYSILGIITGMALMALTLWKGVRS